MFQTFEAEAVVGEAGERLEPLRALLAQLKIDALLVPRADEHQGEYVPASAQRLRWLTGFSGSAGTAVVTRTQAALFVDGRYTVQARQQVDGSAYDILQVPQNTIADWLTQHLEPGATVGFDPWLHTVSEIERLEGKLKPRKITLKPLSQNPIDRIWGRTRPKPPTAPIRPHLPEYAGKPAAEKIADIQAELKKADHDAVVLTLPDSIAWLFNIRGGDVPHNPVATCFAIVPAVGRPELFISPGKLDDEARQHLASVADLRKPSDLSPRLATLKAEGRSVRVDPDTAAWALARKLGGPQRIKRGADPCILPKARKNAVELDGARRAHLRDGVAVTRFLAWLDRAAPSGTLDEITAAERLETMRAETQALREISFDTIAGSGPHGAIVHYRPTRATNRKLESGELFLVDSGGQYLDGTTDITRTVAIGEPSSEMRERFTAVLKGHIAIATLRFPKGTRGIDIDAFARRALWDLGLDFDHGTGHGVGSYLSVHEGPQGISRRAMAALEPGMIISNEPGFYKEGAYGIRLENLVVVTEPEKIAGGDREMMGFETLTLAPFDLRLVIAERLSASERAWLDGYHNRVRKMLAPHLGPEDRGWLEAATRSIGDTSR
jgi:Xaa-Pro aminopeptidase